MYNRRMASFGLCVSGEYEKYIMKDYVHIMSTYL